MVILTTLIGFAVLIMGRQISWIFVAGLGFALGLTYGEYYLVDQPSWMLLLISSIIAILGALLAQTLQRLAAGVAGGFTGWYLSIMVVSYSHTSLGSFHEILPVIIGILCGLLVITYYDWGVITISSLAGAAIIVSGMRFTTEILMIMLISFALLGMTIQAILYYQEDGK